VVDNEDGATSYRVKSYFAVQFHALRRALLGPNDTNDNNNDNNDNNNNANDDDHHHHHHRAPVSEFGDIERLYIQSLSQCIPWAATGGKSNASFCKTLDDRFVVKCVTNHEFDMFLDVAGLYFQHMAQEHSALVQILGPWSWVVVAVRFLVLTLCLFFHSFSFFFILFHSFSFFFILPSFFFFFFFSRCLPSTYYHAKKIQESAQKQCRQYFARADQQHGSNENDNAVRGGHGQRVLRGLHERDGSV
jgi:hypothetical protein